MTYTVRAYTPGGQIVEEPARDDYDQAVRVAEGAARLRDFTSAAVVAPCGRTVYTTDRAAQPART